MTAGGSYAGDVSVYTGGSFHLRPDGRWSNGDAVTADDFLFAWRRVLTPSTGSDYINLFSVIEGVLLSLTGAVFGRDRSFIERARARLVDAAGNFYINDKPTGAVVGQQPFGGGRASGTNDKAGSQLNLMRWTSARSIKETFVPAKTHEYPHMGLRRDLLRFFGEGRDRVLGGVLPGAGVRRRARRRLSGRTAERTDSRRRGHRPCRHRADHAI